MAKDTDPPVTGEILKLAIGLGFVVFTIALLATESDFWPFFAGGAAVAKSFFLIEKHFGKG